MFYKLICSWQIFEQNLDITQHKFNLESYKASTDY